MWVPPFLEEHENKFDRILESASLLTLLCSTKVPGQRKIEQWAVFELTSQHRSMRSGTTAYQWTSVKQSIQERSLKTLAASPFNKMRMCVFPKGYSFGNNTEPWMLPFKKKGGENDPSQPNYEFFQNVDKRVEQLMAMGVQADVILLS